MIETGKPPTTPTPKIQQPLKENSPFSLRADFLLTMDPRGLTKGHVVAVHVKDRGMDRGGLREKWLGSLVESPFWKLSLAGPLF